MFNADKCITDLEDNIHLASCYNESLKDKFGEVFTPSKLIKEMVRSIGIDTLRSISKTYLDPCAGKGNYPIKLIKALNILLADVIPDDYRRLKHIIENQIFMAEMQDTSANFIAYYFQMSEGFKVNLYVGDAFQMPEDFFELSYDERREKYPENCVLDPVEPEKVPEIPANTPSLPRSERVSKAKPSKTSAKPKKSPKIKGEKPDSTPFWLRNVSVDV